MAVIQQITIRRARPGDLRAYTRLLQKVYQSTYTDESRGLGKKYFSMKLFRTGSTQNYLESNIAQGKKQLALLAFAGRRLVGSITIADMGKRCRLQGFYVAMDMQGMGIGRELLAHALRFAKGKEVYLVTYEHNRKAIERYRKWGFGLYGRRWNLHWEVWPEGLTARMVNMRIGRGKYRHLLARRPSKGI